MGRHGVPCAASKEKLLEDGFNHMSRSADAATLASVDRAEQPTLRPNGTDTEAMTKAVTERGSECEQLILDEIRARPLRALGWAAAAGAIVGIWAAR